MKFLVSAKVFSFFNPLSSKSFDLIGSSGNEHIDNLETICVCTEMYPVTWMLVTDVGHDKCR